MNSARYAARQNPSTSQQNCTAVLRRTALRAPKERAGARTPRHHGGFAAMMTNMRGKAAHIARDTASPYPARGVRAFAG